MKRLDVRNGARVVFRGPEGLAPLYEGEKHLLDGKTGTVVYGISEDIWCYPEDPSSDMLWVSFDNDRLPRRQVSAAWLEKGF